MASHARTPHPPIPPRVERRRRRRGAISRLLHAPLPSAAIESRAGRAAGWLARGWPLLALALVAGLLWLVWTARGPVIMPRHRPEALCFALARARFSPPMNVEPGTTVVRGRFNQHTPAAVAVRQAMQFTEDMVLQEGRRQVGDYEVSVLWLRIPGERGHWLVLAWMEDSDLALASFHFAGDATDLAPEELVWGDRLTRAVLVDEYFRAGIVPAFRLRSRDGAPPAWFGPKRPD